MGHRALSVQCRWRRGRLYPSHGGGRERLLDGGGAFRTAAVDLAAWFPQAGWERTRRRCQRQREGVVAGRLVAPALPICGPDLGWGGPLAPSSTSVPLVAVKVWWQGLATATHNRPVAVWRRVLCRARLGLACSCCYVRSTTASSGGGGCSLPRGRAVVVPDLALALSASRPRVGDL